MGRYKYNKKLAIAQRLVNQELAEDMVNPYSGEVLVPAGHVLTREESEQAQNCGDALGGDEQVGISGSDA